MSLQSPRKPLRPQPNVAIPFLAFNSPHFTITAAFVAWAVLKLALALCTPGPAYDTSTAIHLARLHSAYNDPASLKPASLLWRLCERLTRWDAIYFTQAANHGYRNEQEWAFGWGYVQVIVYLQSGLEMITQNSFGPLSRIVLAVVISNASHLLSAIALYHLSAIVFSNQGTPPRRVVPLVAALLHIISPAGLFLSAPYSESLFALLTTTGYWLYAKSTKYSTGIGQSFLLLMSAVILAGSCMVRSNGLLHGIPFLIDFVLELGQFAHRPRFIAIFRIITLGICGLMIAGGLVLPQAIAWRQFCLGSSKAEWCENTVPSVYFWVQDKYWNVGFLRYWTVSNVPLFALAAPTLVVLLKTGVWGVQATSTGTTDTALLWKLSIPQILLAGMAITSYHIQIITRLSSGCVVWYWYVAKAIVEKDENGKEKEGCVIVRWMVLYGLIQGALFSSFLPPA